MKYILMVLLAALAVSVPTFQASYETDEACVKAENNAAYTASDYEQYSAPAEKEINPVELIPPSGNLKIPLIPFVYNSLYRINNIDDPVHAIQVLKGFQYLVCTEPGRLAEKELQVSDAIKSNVKIFGYVHMGGKPLPPLEKIKREIDNIRNNGWYGVFIDQFGYGFGETRARQNSIVDYAHSKGLKCFVNCWFIDDAFGNKADRIHNSKGLQSSLSDGDWYLMESYLVENAGYNEKIKSFLEKSKKAQFYKDKLKVNISALSYKREAASWEESSGDIESSYMVSLMMGFDGWWFTDRTESDSFDHGNPVDLDIGNSLEQSLTEGSSGFYISQTEYWIKKSDIINDFMVS